MIYEQEIKKWFSEEVKERMEDLNLKSYNIANFCKIENYRMSGYLHANPFPSVWKLILIAEVLECCVNDLLGFDEVEDVDSFEKFLASSTYLGEDEFTEHFSKRLLDRMSIRGVSPKQLSSITSISLTTIERYVCNNPSLPNAKNLLLICDALDYTPSDLLGY